MMGNKYFWGQQSAAFGLVGVVCIGCAYFSKKASVQAAVSDQGAPESIGKIAVPHFLHEKYKAGKGENAWPDSAITDRFVTGLLQHGYRVLDRARIRKIMRDNSIEPTELYDENNVQKIGMLLHVDTVVLGKLTLIEKEDGTILSRKLNVRAVRVLDGAVVFSVSSIDTTPYRSLTGEDLVDQGIAKMFETEDSGPAEEAGTVENNISSTAAGSAKGALSLERDEENTPSGETTSDFGAEADEKGEAALEMSTADDGARSSSLSEKDSLFVDADSPSSTPSQGEKKGETEETSE